MPDLDFLLAAAYDNGQLAGRAIRWLFLLAVSFKLVQRITRGSWGPGFRRSPLGTGIGLVAVVVGLIASVAYDFGGDDRAAARVATPPDMSTVRATIIGGCTGTGEKRSACACYADEVLRRTGHDHAQLAALERDMNTRQQAGQDPPALVLQAAEACVGPG